MESLSCLRIHLSATGVQSPTEFVQLCLREKLDMELCKLILIKKYIYMYQAVYEGRKVPQSNREQQVNKYE